MRHNFGNSYNYNSSHSLPIKRIVQIDSVGRTHGFHSYGHGFESLLGQLLLQQRNKHPLPLCEVGKRSFTCKEQVNTAYGAQ